MNVVWMFLTLRLLHSNKDGQLLGLCWKILTISQCCMDCFFHYKKWQRQICLTPWLVLKMWGIILQSFIKNTICSVNWNFKIYFVSYDTMKPPVRDSGTIWWSAQPTEGCQSIPEALQIQLSRCKFSLWTARSRWGKPCHHVENRPVVLSQRQDTI